MSFDTATASSSIQIQEEDFVSSGYRIEAVVRLPRDQRIEHALVLWKRRTESALAPIQASMSRAEAKVLGVRLMPGVQQALLGVELALAHLVHAAARQRPLSEEEADLVESAAQGDWRSVSSAIEQGAAPERSGRSLDVLLVALLRVGLLPRSPRRDPRAIPVLATRLYQWTAAFCSSSQPRAALCAAIRSCGAALRRWGEAGTQGWDQPTPSLDRLCGPAEADRLVDALANVDLVAVTEIPGTPLYASCLSAPLGLVISATPGRRSRASYHVSIIDWDGSAYAANLGDATAGMTAQAAAEIFSIIGHDAEELLDGYAGGPSLSACDATTRARNQLGVWLRESPTAA